MKTLVPKRTLIKLIILSVISTLLVLCSQHVGIFWDNVLAVSKIGSAIFARPTFSLRMPVELDPGHPPFIGALMAMGWSIWGRSLLTSHFLMLPFIVGVLWQIDNLLLYFFKNRTLHFFCFLLVIVDPTLLSQFVLVNMEVIQVFFFLLALNAILKEKTAFKTVGLMFLGIISLRGMMLCAGVFLIDISLQLFIHGKKPKAFVTPQNGIAYLLGALPACIYIFWRLVIVGWLRIHPESPWAESNQLADVEVFFRNILVLIQRFVDFGRVTVILIATVLLFINRKNPVQKIKTLIIITLCSTLIIMLTSLFSTNEMGHRYFITSYLAIVILAFYLIQPYKFKWIAYISMICSLLLGNLIVYPDHISQGWDASLAHLPYWGLRDEALTYMDQNDIPVSATASFFPNATSLDNITLNSNMEAFQDFSGNEQYVFYSNVYNLSDEHLLVLKNDYLNLKEFRQNRVRIELLQKR